MIGVACVNSDATPILVCVLSIQLGINTHGPSATRRALAQHSLPSFRSARLHSYCALSHSTHLTF
jgi:hypothetical protein